MYIIAPPSPSQPHLKSYAWKQSTTKSTAASNTFWLGPCAPCAMARKASSKTLGAAIRSVGGSSCSVMFYGGGGMVCSAVRPIPTIQSTVWKPKHRTHMTPHPHTTQHIHIHICTYHSYLSIHTDLELVDPAAHAPEHLALQHRGVVLLALAQAAAVVHGGEVGCGVGGWRCVVGCWLGVAMILVVL